MSEQVQQPEKDVLVRFLKSAPVRAKAYYGVVALGFPEASAKLREYLGSDAVTESYRVKNSKQFATADGRDIVELITRSKDIVLRLLKLSRHDLYLFAFFLRYFLHRQSGLFQLKDVEGDREFLATFVGDNENLIHLS